MDENKKNNVVELEDDALENAAGGAGAGTRGRGGRETGSSVSEEERKESQMSQN